MKLTKTPYPSSLIRSFVLILAFAFTSLTSYVANAHPFAANITGTNGAGFVSFTMNEPGATVVITFDDASTTNYGVLPRGTTNFYLGSHVSYSINATKLGNGVPFLIGGEGTNGGYNYANPGGIDVNKNAKIGSAFGRVYMIQRGSSGGYGYGTANFHAQGVQMYNIDMTDSTLGRGTNAAGIALWAAGNTSDPWHLRVLEDNTVLVNCDANADAALYQFDQDMTTSNQVLGVVGNFSPAPFGVHADFGYGTPLAYGSLAQSNLVVWTGDDNLNALNIPFLGPNTDPGAANCLFRYDVGSGEYVVTNATVHTNFALATAAPFNNAVATATLVQNSVATATVAAGGSGYTASDVLTIQGGTGTSATATVLTVDGGGAVLTVAITTSGSYTALPSSPAATTGGTGTGATLNLNFGSGNGYLAADTLTVSGGTGTAATATVSTVGDAGAITAITLATAGNYSAVPATPAATSTSGAGTGASLTLAFGTGSGYTAADTLTLSGGTVATVASTVTVSTVSSLGVITAVAVGTPGQYKTAPATPNSPTGGSGANAKLALTFTPLPQGGSGYVVGDVLSINGGTGISATVTVATVSGGAVTSVTQDNKAPNSYGRYIASSTANFNPPTPNSPDHATVNGGSGSGLVLDLVIRGPLPWIHHADYAFTLGLEGIAGLRIELDRAPNGNIFAGFGRSSVGSGANVQELAAFPPCFGLTNSTFFSSAASNLVYTSYLTTGGTSDPWNGINGSGANIGSQRGTKVSPDGKFLASLDFDNGVTLGYLTNGVPDDGTIFGIANPPTTISARGLCWDAADNIWTSSSGQLAVRTYSLGLSSSCTTSNDYTGNNGSFSIVTPGVTATLSTTNATATQNYVNNPVGTNPGQNPGSPIPTAFHIALNTNDLTANGAVAVSFSRAGTAVYGVNYTMLTNALNTSAGIYAGGFTNADGVVLNTNLVIFPAAVWGHAGNWFVDVPITPTATPVSGPTLTVIVKVFAGANYSQGVPFNKTISILNTGPQVLALSGGGNFTRAIPNDYARFTITRTGDLNGPGNDSVNPIVATAYTVTNWNYYGTAVSPTDYGALAQVLDTSNPFSTAPPTNGGNTVVIPAGVVTITPCVGNPVKHTDLSQAPVTKTVIINTTNRVSSPSTTCTSSEGLTYTVTAAAVTLNEFDNTIGKNEVVIWSDPLTNANEFASWNLTFANTGRGTDPVLPYLSAPWDGQDWDALPDGNHDFYVKLGKAVADDSVPQSDLMVQSNYTTALKMSVNKNLGFEAGVNLYPRIPLLNGNYALRFDMFLSLQLNAYSFNNPGPGLSVREFAAFGVNHNGTNCNWRLDVNPRVAHTGSGPTNWDGNWFAIDAGSGSITPADYDGFRSPALPNNTLAGGGTDLISFTATAQTAIFKHPPFAAMTPFVGGEPANQWVPVSIEVKQTNLNSYCTLFMENQIVFSPPGGMIITNNPGLPMLGYLDPNKTIGDAFSQYVYYSNVRAVELAPYILANPTKTNSTAVSAIVAQFQSLSLTSSATFASNPLTNKWYKGTGTINNGLPGTPVLAGVLGSNSVAATSMNDTFTNTFNSATDGTNYMCVFSDLAGSITSQVVSVEVVLGPTNKLAGIGQTTNLTVVGAGPVALTAYRWYSNNVNNFATAAIVPTNSHLNPSSGVNLFFTNVVAADGVFYWASVTNPAGSVVVGPATLTTAVLPNNAVVAPASQSALWGSTVQYTVTASGDTPFTYQWKTNGVKLVNGAHYAGVTTATLSVSNITRADAGGAFGLNTISYNAGVTNVIGGTLSTTGLLSVIIAPASISNTLSSVGGTTTIRFGSTNGFDTTNAFILQGSVNPNGPYTNTPGTFSVPVGGGFQVTTPQSDVGNMFYRLLHVQ